MSNRRQDADRRLPYGEAGWSAGLRRWVLGMLVAALTAGVVVGRTTAYPVLAAVGLAAGIVISMLLGTVLARASNPLPRKPSRPTMTRVERFPPLVEPPRLVLEPSLTCEICGRSLTRPESQLARVGTECIKIYGPRNKSVPNPAHEDWSHALIARRVQEIEARTRAEGQYRRELESYRNAIGEWEEEINSPTWRAALTTHAQTRTLRWFSLLAAVLSAAACLVVGRF